MFFPEDFCMHNSKSHLWSTTKERVYSIGISAVLRTCCDNKLQSVLNHHQSFCLSIDIEIA